jgi:4-coumarate--CoA ligase
MVIFKSPFKPVQIANEPFGDFILANLWKHAVENPEKKAIISAEDESISVTYSDLYVQSLSVASFLHQRHFGHGDIACLVLPNCYQWVPIFLGCSLQGGAVSGASVVFTDYELERQFIDSKSKIVFCSETSLDRVLKAAKNCPLINTIVIVESDPKHPIKDYPFGIHKFSDVLKTPPMRGVPAKDIDINRDILLLPYSSGTTGSPKGVMISHRNFGTMINIINAHLQDYVQEVFKGTYKMYEETDILLLPFYHIYGFGVLMNVLCCGKTAVLLTHFDPDVFFRSIEKFKVKMLMLVPPILVALAKHPIAQKYNLSSLTICISGAAPAGKDLIDEVKRKHPSLKYIVQGYGMTECSMASHLPDFKEFKHGSCGRVGSLGEMKIIDVESGKELNFEERGEILLRSPTIMMGYLGRPQATAETIDDNGWLHTGDIGYVNKEGDLFIVERLKELIKVKGLQVPPAELEDLLLSHPQIRDAAVIGIPDEDAGEVPKAYVVRATEDLTEKQVQEYVKQRVAHYKQLKGGVEFINEIPKSAAGKILRRFLRDKNAAAVPQLSKL